MLWPPAAARITSLVSRVFALHLRTCFFGCAATIATACAASLCIFINPAQAASCQAWTGEHEVLEGKIIGPILIQANDIFDNALLSENNAIHRFANSLHYQTKKTTVSRQLLFAPGDAFSQRVLDESERLLRSQSYLADAEVSVLQLCGDEVWIKVKTVDTWSTIPEISFSRVAGESQRTIALEENNLMGRGQELSFSYERDLDRVSRALSYTHRDWRGRRQVLHTELQNNQDGERYQLSLTRPYFSFDDTYSWTINGHFDRRESKLYALGEVVETIGVERHFLDANRGWSQGIEGDRLERWTLGVRLDTWEYYGVDDTVHDRLFENSREYLPYIRLEKVQDQFEKFEHIRKLAGTEDINLGAQYSFELGYMARLWGSHDDAMFLMASHQRAYKAGHGALLISESTLQSFVSSNALQQLQGSTLLQAHRRLTPQDQLFMELKLEAGHSMREHQQLAIGGESGLRGYPFKAQTGNRLARLSAEFRHYPDWHPWHLLRFGGALFADYGAAWHAGATSPEWLWDIGVGLRLGSSRSSSGRVLHLDFALPEGGGSPQWTATAKRHF